MTSTNQSSDNKLDPDQIGAAVATDNINQAMSTADSGSGSTTTTAAAAAGERSSILANLKAACTAAAPAMHTTHQIPANSLSSARASLFGGSLGLTPTAAQQQLLAMAQLLSSINPGLAEDAIAMARAFGLDDTSDDTSPAITESSNGGGGPGSSSLHRHHPHHRSDIASQQPHSQSSLLSVGTAAAQCPCLEVNQVSFFMCTFSNKMLYKYLT